MTCLTPFLSLKPAACLKAVASMALVLTIAGCTTTESHRVVTSPTVDSYRTAYTGERTTIVVGNFNNSSNYMQGLFSAGGDQLGNQAKTILKTHLQQTNRFNLVDRENLGAIEREAQYRGTKQQISGARYAVTGSVTEFGRRETGDRQLFGVLGAGKQQLAYAKVMLNVVDVVTSEVIYSTQGAGEYVLSNREIVGFGSQAGYDSTLNGKVLNLAITEAVNSVVRDLHSGALNVQQ